MTLKKFNFELCDLFSIIGVALDVLNYWQNLNQTSNDVIFKELQKQNKEYLEKILCEIKKEKSNE